MLAQRVCARGEAVVQAFWGTTFLVRYPRSWCPEGTIKGAWGMKFRRWLVRGLGLACLVLAGAVLSGGGVSLTARPAYAQTVGSVIVQGNQRVEADPIRPSFHPGTHGRLGAFERDESVKDMIKHSETGLLLSFLQTGDIYDPDGIEADRELLRRFYLKHGFIDVRIVSALAEYDPNRRGFVVTFTIDEGEQYRVGTVDVQSAIRPLDPALLRVKLRVYPGDVYNAEAVEKTVEDMTIEASRQGFAFATVRPSATRDAPTHTVNLLFTVSEGQPAYIQRTHIPGNTPTPHYSIRPAYHLPDGDA